MIVTKVDITSAKKINKVALVYLLHTHVGPKTKNKTKTFHGQWGRGCGEMRKGAGGLTNSQNGHFYVCLC